MDVENAVLSETPSSCHEKKRRKRKDVVKNVETNYDCPEGTSCLKDTPLEPPVMICTNGVPTNTEATMSEPTANVASVKKKNKIKSKASEDVISNGSVSLEKCASVKDTHRDPPVDICTIVVPTEAEATALEPPASVTTEKKKKKKKSKIADDFKMNADHKSALVENNASVMDTLQEPPVVVPTKVEATALEPPASVTSEKKKKKKKKKSKMTDEFTMNADHENAVVKNASVMDAPEEPPVNIGAVAVSPKTEATALEPAASVTSEKKLKKKMSKITDELMNADHKNASVEKDASVMETPQEPRVNMGKVEVPTKAVATQLEPPTSVTSEKKKKKKKNKKKNKMTDDFTMNADYESALVENNASVKDTHREPLVNIGTVEVPAKAEAIMLDPTNVTVERKKRKKRKKRSKTNDDFEMNSVDRKGAPSGNSALVIGTSLDPPVNINTLSVPTEAEEATALESPTNVTSEKKKKKKKRKASYDSKMNVVDLESASLENSASAKDTPVVPLVNLSMVAVPSEVEAMTLEPRTTVASEEKKKKKRHKTSDDSGMNCIDHESASLENSASIKDTPVVPSANLFMAAVPIEVVATTIVPPNVTLEEKKKKKKCKASNDSKMNSIDHESASFENSASANDTPVVPLENLSMVAVPPVAEAEVLDHPTNVASEKKRKKKKRKTRHNTEVNAVEHDSASLENSASERHLHMESALGIDTVTNSERYPSESVVSTKLVTTSAKKKKWKRSRRKDPDTNNIDNENLNAGVGREQQFQEIPHLISNERTTNLENPTPNLDLCCSEGKTVEGNMKKIRKQKNEKEMRQNVHENNDDKVLDGTVQPYLRSSVGIEPEVEPLCAQSSLSNDVGEERDDKKFCVREIDAMDQALQQNVGIPSQGDFVAEVAGLNSTGVIENCPTSEEQSGLSNGINNGSTKNHGGYTEVCEVTESREDETCKQRKKNYHANGRKFSDSGDIRRPVEDMVDNDASTPCLIEENTSVALDNKFEKTCSGIDTVAERVIDNLIEKDSVNHLDNEPEFGQREKLVETSDIRKDSRSRIYPNNSAKLDVSEGAYEQKNGGMLVTRHDASKAENSCGKENGSSDLSKLDAIKKEITREEAPFSTNYGQVEDLVHLDASIKEGNSSQMPNTLPERSVVAHSKKKLLILDVNGILVEFVSQVPVDYRPHIRISKKGVFKRPYCDDFLQFCFERFTVAVWSSRMKYNVDKVVNFLFDQTRHKLLFCWDQSHCTPTGLNTLENKSKPLVLKELRKVWEKLEPDLPFEKGEYDETNTLLLDDSPYKALRNPVNTAVFPFPYRFQNRQDNSLGPGGDLRTYLEGLSMANNVKEYVEQNPFGQEAITKLHKQWGFYCKIVASADEPASKL